MKKLLALFVIMLGFVSAANAATNYWVTTDRTLDGIYMNVRLVQTSTDIAPTTTTLGKDVSVSAGPFTSKVDAKTNCEKTLKAVKKNGQLANNYCGQTVSGR